MLDKKFSFTISKELSLPESSVLATMKLMAEGSTVPFMARYRKEATGNLDEVQITAIRDRLNQLLELETRRATVLKSIQEQNKLTDELKKKIEAAATLAVLEDLYLPYKPKRKTKASVAREKGLDPLALFIFEQKDRDPRAEAKKYVDPKKDVKTVEEAIQGACDIIAEMINEDVQARAKLRKLYFDSGVMVSKVIRGKDKEGENYKDYFDWQELAKASPSHRILAVRRGEKEGILSYTIQPPPEDALVILKELFVKGRGEDSALVHRAMEDSFKRLLSPSLETEMRIETKKRADAEAIEVFKNNLRQLLMESPMGKKRVLAIDPGLRTGCKCVCLDPQGKLLDNETIYISASEGEKRESAEVINALVKKHKIEVIAIGNGTGSREAFEFIKSLKLPKEIVAVFVSETGASIYSASEVAREEFPTYDVTVRGAISIGRRLIDPLAELVKIDPKSVGVGQYQHDVDQILLKKCLDDVVASCVNHVGVEVNTASKQLLMYVAGIGPSRAQAIVDVRNQKGVFKNRAQIAAIPGFGAKAFEQAGGFLRISDGENPLDASAVHPESYPIVEKICKDLGCTVPSLIQNAELVKRIQLKDYQTENVGLYTLADIKEELLKPGRDPREPFQLFAYDSRVNSINDLKPGMKLPGVVTNITAFGAFVDIGVHQDGLVHISELSNKFVKDPHEVISLHQKVKVTVLDVDAQRNRIALSLKSR